MVAIGFDKEYNVREIFRCLQNSQVSPRSKITFFTSEKNDEKLKNICFYEVETRNLIDEWFCCWGGIYQLTLSREELHTDFHRMEYLQKRIRLFDDDISFWLDFSKNFVKQFGTIALFRFYPELTLPIKIQELKLEELTGNKLLEMECNQMFLISNTGDDSLC